MNKANRLLAALLVLIMTFSVTACRKKGDNGTSSDSARDNTSDDQSGILDISDDQSSDGSTDSDGNGDNSTTGGGNGTGTGGNGGTASNRSKKLKIMCRTFPLYVNGIKGMAFNSDYQKKTGVTVEWIEVTETTINERITATMASGDLPDVIINGISALQVREYSKQGLLAELKTDVIKKNAPNIWKCINSSADVKKSITQKDGKIYSIPDVRGVDNIFGSRLYINKKWLDKLGLKVPTTYTAFRNVMKQFVTKDPNGNGINDEVGLVMETVNGLMVGGPQGIEWETSYDNMYVDSNKKIHYFFASEAYRKSLQFLNSLYKDGTLDMDTFSCARTVAKACNTNTEVGAFVNLAASITMPEKKINDYVPIAPLKADASVKRAVAPTTRGSEINGCGAVITAAAVKNGRVETALSWFDYFYTPEGYFYKEFGPAGYYYKNNADGTKTGIKYASDGKTPLTDNDRYKWAPGWIFPGWSKGAHSLWKDTGKQETVIEKYYKKYDQTEASKLYANAASKYYIREGSLVFDSAADKKIPKYKSTLHKYAQNCIIPFVNGSISTDTGWADYQAELKRLGVADLEKIYQTAYDNSN